MKAKIGALILSGGKSRRMGRDKTTTEYCGETFLTRAVKFWKEVPGISVIYLGIGSGAHLAELQKDPGTHALLQDPQIRPVTDLYPGCGPMAGIHAAFCAGEEDYLYVCAIDMLKMEHAALPVPDDTEKDVFVYRDGEFIEPLFGLYSRRVLQTAETLLASGRYKMQLLLNAVPTEYIPVREEQKGVFTNVNTPEELEKLTRKRME